jgi:peroxiredoxin
MESKQANPFPLPPNLPVPIDDGAADHLRGIRLPDLELPATIGPPVRLSDLDRAVIFAYPRTGVPEHPPGPDWDAIPGARGCTPHSCGFRDLRAEYDAIGVRVLGLSTQSTSFQLEFAQRTHFSFPILSDENLALTRLLRLPTFEFDVASMGGGGPSTLLKRMAWYIERGVIRHLWYPVFPSDKNAEDVLAWLRAQKSPR